MEEQKNIDYKREYLQALLNMRNDYLDDLPEERITPHNNKDYYKYKCRGNFFNGVRGIISRLISLGIIKEHKTVKEGQEFCEFFKKRDSATFFKKEDIDYVNKIMDLFIKELNA